MENKVKLGFIGVGSIFDVHIAEIIKNPSVEIYAFCDVDEDKVKEKGEKYGVKNLFTDYNEMLKLKEIDGIVVCTWNRDHAPASIASLKAGKHVFCEKPMAINVEEARLMLETAKQVNRNLMVGFVRRFGDDCKAVQSFVDSGCLGSPYFAKAKYIRRNGYPGGWFGIKEYSGGGPLIDLGVHVIDLIRYVTGSPKPISVYATTSNKLGMLDDVVKPVQHTSQTKIDIKKSDVEDFAAAMIRFDNGMVLSVETSFTLNGEDSAEVSIYGDKGGMMLEPNMKLYSVMNGYCVNTVPVPEAKFDWNNAFYNQMDTFVKAIRGEVSTMHNAEDGVILMSILSAAYESARTGHEVVLN